MALALVGGAGRYWLRALLGATLAYHALSTWRETHRGQSDLQRVGFLFAWMFLPGINCLASFTLVAAAVWGADAAGQHLADCGRWTAGAIGWLGSGAAMP